ncbi:ATP-binding cassette domain-containing protein [Methyloglobulus sp.]|uniref:ABC transporter ATP-binding protein n=1 Tax=Methyloglobulus sp. TaxID=2518622 RepID=UPI0039897DB0
MIEVNALDVHSPDGRLLLEHLSFKLGESDRLAFTGPNGCGKSTLLRCIAGLEGQVNKINRSLPLTETAYLPTRPLDLLLPWGSVRENIDFFKSAVNKRTKKSKTETETFSGFFRALDYSPGDEDRFHATEVYRLSSGQQALLAIYCALSQLPKLLIADEIFSTLSEQLRSKVAKRLLEQNLTIVCATHDTDFIKSLNASVFNLDNSISSDEHHDF